MTTTVWRPLLAAVSFLGLLVCMFAVAASNTEGGRLMVFAALLPWLVSLVWHGATGRKQLLWLGLIPLGIGAGLLLMFAQFEPTSRHVYPMRGLAVTGRIVPQRYTVRIECQLGRTVCAANHELTLNGATIEIAERRVEPGRRGLLVRDVAVPPLTTVQLQQLPPGSSGAVEPVAPRPPSAEDGLLAVDAKEVCAEIARFPRGAFSVAYAALAKPSIAPRDRDTEDIRWCTQAASEGIRFAYIEPHWQVLAPLVRPFDGINPLVAAGLALLISLTARVLGWRP